MNPSDEHPTSTGYRTMMDRIRDWKTTVSEPGGIHQLIDQAVEKAVELEELSREEAERIGDYLRRDVHDAAEYLATTEKEMGDWLRFDLELIEERLLETFSVMVDHTREALDEIEARAAWMTNWQTGEITGPGTLVCTRCGQLLHFHQPGRIPVCPQCGERDFKRVEDEADA